MFLIFFYLIYTLILMYFPALFEMIKKMSQCVLLMKIVMLEVCEKLQILKIVTMKNKLLEFLNLRMERLIKLYMLRI